MEPQLIPERVVEGQRLGWHRHHKPENKQYPVTRALSYGTGLTTKSWKRARSPLDQGQLGSCTGNACEMACYEMAGHVPADTKTEAQAVSLYKLATTLDNVPGSYPPDDTGSTTVGVLSAAKQKGYVKSYRWAFSFDEALQTLVELGPVITGVDWYEGFDTPKANGELVIAGQVRGGHELCLDAIFPNTSWQGGGYVEGWNSWGKSWGPLGGRFRWSWSTWKFLLAQGGEVGVGLAAA